MNKIKAVLKNRKVLIACGIGLMLIITLLIMISVISSNSEKPKATDNKGEPEATATEADTEADTTAEADTTEAGTEGDTTTEAPTTAEDGTQADATTEAPAAEVITETSIEPVKDHEIYYNPFTGQQISKEEYESISQAPENVEYRAPYTNEIISKEEYYALQSDHKKQQVYYDKAEKTQNPYYYRKGTENIVYLDEYNRIVDIKNTILGNGYPDDEYFLSKCKEVMNTQPSSDCKLYKTYTYASAFHKETNIRLNDGWHFYDVRDICWNWKYPDGTWTNFYYFDENFNVCLAP